MHRSRFARAARLSSVAAICFLAGCLAVPVGGAVQLPSDLSEPSDSHHYFRRYQATAYISLLGVTIFSRSNVGFGYAKADEEVFAHRRNISLQFLSGSLPERAHGLNRFGLIQENIRERNRVCAEADYFGLITASGEESLSQAKAALDAKSDKTAFIAAQASINPQSARYSIRHLDLSSSYRGSNAEQLLGQVHDSFSHSEAGQSEHQQALEGGAMGTFLYSVREAMLAPANKLETRFIYNGKTFSMLSEKREDHKAGLELHNAGLIANASSALMLTGAIRNEKTNEVTNFRLWFDRTSPDLLPLRFEFRPKSYLRLVFQAVPDGSLAAYFSR
jgi:hypothetical protein